MNVVAQIDTPSVAGVLATHDSASLSAFAQAEFNAAIWQRQMPLHIQNWLKDLDANMLPAGRVIIPPEAVEYSIGHLFDRAHVPSGSERDWLQSDIAFLANTFSQIMSSKYIRLRLDVVAHNACRKFHIDALKARLICTYRGTGTQYGNTVSDNDPDQIFTVPTGAPILLRGTLWPARTGTGLRHRSPPIAGTGETRLLLVLDPVDDPENEV